MSIDDRAVALAGLLGGLLGTTVLAANQVALGRCNGIAIHHSNGRGGQDWGLFPILFGTLR